MAEELGEYLPSIYFVRINHAKGSGLTNQIFSIVSSIIKCLFKNKRAVAIDSFCVDINTNERINISDILDLDKINSYLRDKYNIMLLDKNTMHFKLTTAYYGVVRNMHNITEYISEFIDKRNNILVLPKNISFNLFKGDPYPGVIKCFILNYSFDNYNFIDSFNENLPYDIRSNVESEVCSYDFEPSIHFIKNIPELFHDILKHIYFKYVPSFLEFENHLSINNFEKINVIHLRLENDAIQYWGNVNNMDFENFKTYMENKYIDLIKKYICKDEVTIILSLYIENRVTNFMLENGYPFYYVKKEIDGNKRELYAINDLQLSSKCNNIYIGNFDMKTFKGSSFSYYILQNLKYSYIKKISIELDNITNTENVFY